MERVHLDILGPFNTSEYGNRYVLMMIDQFTKWVEMAAIPEQSALTIAEKFVVHFETDRSSSIHTGYHIHWC
jgi:hypothetical protein